MTSPNGGIGQDSGNVLPLLAKSNESANASEGSARALSAAVDQMLSGFRGSAASAAANVHLAVQQELANCVRDLRQLNTDCQANVTQQAAVDQQGQQAANQVLGSLPNMGH